MRIGNSKALLASPRRPPPPPPPVPPHPGRAGAHGLDRQRAAGGAATCLSLLSNAVGVWNTMQMSRIIAQLRANGETIADEDLARVSPLACSHVSPNGTYFSPSTVVERARSHNGYASAVDSERSDNL